MGWCLILAAASHGRGLPLDFPWRPWACGPTRVHVGLGTDVTRCHRVLCVISPQRGGPGAYVPRERHENDVGPLGGVLRLRP